MPLKDYYNILNIQSSATQAEIKKAYRKLALQFHPDKNEDNPYAVTQFAAIKEAYEVLTNPARKEYYLQQRWYNQSMGKKNTSDIITPVTVLKQLLELDKYVFTLDVHRMDKQGLTSHIQEILSDEVITQLKIFNEQEINNQIIITTIKTMEPLPFKQAESISTRLLHLADDSIRKKIIEEFINLKKQKEKVDTYQPLFILFIVIVICFLIWLLAR